MGAYSGKVSAREMEFELRKSGGLFDGSSKKINFLYHMKAISEPTLKYLKTAKDIRNKLAHQYSPHSQIVSDEIVEQFGTWQEALCRIYNLCWHHLIVDYAAPQVAVLTYLEDNSQS